MTQISKNKFKQKSEKSTQNLPTVFPPKLVNNVLNDRILSHKTHNILSDNQNHKILLIYLFILSVIY